MQDFPGADPVPDFATSPGTDDGGDGTGASPRLSVTWDRQSSLASSSFCSDAEGSEVDYGGYPPQSEIEEIPSPLWLSPLRPRWPPIHQPQSLEICPVKVVLTVDFHDNKVMQKVLNKFRCFLLGTSYDVAGRTKAMRSLAKLAGVDSITVDMKDKKMTVIGVADPVDIVGKLRKFCHTEILSIGPAKEPKKEEPKKEDAKKEEDKKANEMLAKYLEMYKSHPYMNIRYVVYSAEEDPNAAEEDPNACSIM